MYKKHICKLFNYLSKHAKINQHCRGFSGQLSSTNNAIQSNKNDDFEINFNPMNININKLKIIKGPAKIFLSIGGKINFTNTSMDQSISVCLNIKPEKKINSCDIRCHPELDENSGHILRRFHFDIDTSQEEWPVSHLQYGGKIHATQKEDNYYGLFQLLDDPRIPIPPTDIVQVLNIFLCQFKTDILPVFQGSAWGKLVTENDEIWRKYYHKPVFDTLSKSGNKLSLYDLAISHPMLY